MKFVRVTRALNDRGVLIREDEVQSYLENADEAYVSIYRYNDEQFQTFQYTGTVRGMKDVFTNKLVFDFDNKENPDAARLEAQGVIHRLAEAGIQKSDVEIYFSGNKGFNLIITLPHELNPKQTAALAKKFTEGINVDLSLYDAPQVLRYPGTKHPKSGLHKIALSYDQLNTMSLEEIKKLAANNVQHKASYTVANPPEDFFNVPEEPEKPTVVQASYDVDFSRKSPGWKNCKWSLLQGNFKPGERHNALMVIAATCRALNYDKNTTYHMCKSAIEKQAHLFKEDKFPKKELWENIINQSIFSDNWEGGQYSCKSDPWLGAYCKSLGHHACKSEEVTQVAVNVTDMASQFEKYATDFDKNIIKTGLKSLDEHVMLCAATLNGLLAQPGAGKTSFALSYLRNTSVNNIDSMFFSLDMAMPIIFAKLIQKRHKCSFRKALEVYRSDAKTRQEITESLRTEYGRVGFNFAAGLTAGDMKRVVQEREDQIGRPVKLVVIDYLECIAGPYQEPTANAGFIANQLKDLANELQTCVLLLLQTQKHSTPDISDPLLSMKQIKGSSVIEQACSVVMTLWREGYNPRTVDEDKYVSMAAVKNRLDSLWTGDFSWDGMRGEIAELAEEQRVALNAFRNRKKEQKIKDAEASAGKGWF